MFDSGLTSYSEQSKQPGIIQLEHSLLKIAAIPNLTRNFLHDPILHKQPPLY